MQKLDEYRICIVCHGSGQVKEFVPMGMGCTREMLNDCTHCDDGLVRKDGARKEEPNTNATQSKSIADDQSEPAYGITRETDNEEEEWLKIEVQLPGVEESDQISAGIVNMKTLELDATPVTVLQSNPRWRTSYSLQLELPSYVDDEDMECVFDRNEAVLRIRVPVVVPE
eukprot:TRINITY_DN136_c0_g1_i14.p1 TRINITY_DN136_c0_g1~~TRINITY_DN136_c0_g1_i14.p1  ORF type:complete len:170 (+),score=34.53 TRINITY_DN136_c0_g1_i14:454-963(+)